MSSNSNKSTPESSIDSNTTGPNIPHQTAEGEATPGTSRNITSKKRKREAEENDERTPKAKRTLSEAAYQNKTTLLNQKKPPLFIRSILRVLKESVIGEEFIVTQPSQYKKTVLLVIEKVPDDVINNKQKELNLIINNFSNKTVFLDNIPFAQEVKNQYLLKPETPREDSFSVIFPPSKNISVSVPENADSHSKLALLTSPIALMSEKYPLSTDTVPFANSHNFRYSKQKYDAVSNESPLYALDCEYTQEVLTWMALVDQNHNTVYEFEYEANADNKKNKSNIKKVRNNISKCIPSDAILVGHSLNHDLTVLRTIHPYVIDSSIVYRTCEHKYSLKDLSSILLQETIQTSRQHSPIEDAIASMKLVQKKLDDIKPASNEPSTIGNDLKNREQYQNSFFPLIESNSKQFVLIGSEEDLGIYTSDFVPASTRKVIEEDPETIMEAIKQEIKQSDFLMAHLNLNSSADSTCQDLIVELYNSCPKDTMVTVVLAPLILQSAVFRKGLFINKEKKDKELVVK